MNIALVHDWLEYDFSKSPIPIIIVGDGVAKKSIEEKIQRDHINNVRLLPIQPKDKYSLVIHSSDVELVTICKGAKNTGCAIKDVKRFKRLKNKKIEPSGCPIFFSFPFSFTLIEESQS